MIQYCNICLFYLFVQIKTWNRGNIWYGRNVKIFPNTACTGELILDGKAMSSGNFPNNNWIRENTFADNNSRRWEGRAKNDLFLILIEFTGGRYVKCISFIDMSATSEYKGAILQICCWEQELLGYQFTIIHRTYE